MKQLTAKELNDYLATGVATIKIDVREAHELANGMLDNAMHIPMQSIPQQLPNIEQYKNEPVILICRSGKRSDQVGQYLEQFGFTNLINLVGGMNAWAVDIDSSMTVY
jgi:rhodanese-related sulfurtransferase